MSGPSHPVIAAAHFPPPVHGNSVATERFASLLEARTAVVRLDISAPSRPGSRLRHHLVRSRQTLRAVGTVLRTGRQGGGFYLGCDGGLGMAYTTTLVLAARLRGLRRFVHHHSYAYISRRSRLMALVVAAGGAATTHIVSCDRQAEELRARYPSVVATRSVPVTYVLEEPPPQRGRERPGHRFVLGHLSNLSVDKGLEAVFQTLRRSVEHLDLELVLAGPPATVEDERVLRRGLDAAGGRARYLGPVYGADKDAFYGTIDVFLFPTRYRHESFGIVAAEAMGHGVPVIAYRAGCLDQTWSGGGLILEPDQDFVDRAVAQVQHWVDDPAAFAATRTAAWCQAEDARRHGCAAAAQLAADLSGQAAG